MAKKTNTPQSDQTARTRGEDLDREPAGELAGRSTSNKSGKHSSVEKLAASRPHFGNENGTKPTDGATGSTGKRTARPPIGMRTKVKEPGKSK